MFFNLISKNLNFNITKYYLILEKKITTEIEMENIICTSRPV